MSKLPKFCVWFKEVGKKDGNVVGGKGANLGEMVQSGIPVPPGFIVTAQAYFYFLDKTNLREVIQKKLTNLNVENSHRLQIISEEIKHIIETASVPKEIEETIVDYYHDMAKSSGFVAVRSSATAEDLPEASFAGQQRTYLNIKGDQDVLKAVLGCWA